MHCKPADQEHISAWQIPSLHLLLPDSAQEDTWILVSQNTVPLLNIVGFYISLPIFEIFHLLRNWRRQKPIVN